LLARFEKFLRPPVVQALTDPFSAAQRGNALFAAEPGQHDPDLLFSRILFARLALDSFDQLAVRI